MGHLLIAILLNVVPLIGVWKFGWSGGTVLLLFWVESLLGHFAAMIKIRRHAALTRKRGHVAYVSVDQRGGGGSYFAHFTRIALIFTFAHGFFLGVILAMLAVNRPELTQFNVSWDNFKLGFGLVLLLLVVDLIIDLPQLAQRSFYWLESSTGKRLTRVLVMHLTLIFGFGAMAVFESPIAMLMVFLALKTLLDAGTSMYKDDASFESTYPKKPPAILRFLDKYRKKDGAQTGSAAKKETLDEFWARGRTEALQRREMHEQVLHEQVVDTAETVQRTRHKAE
ncbi:MAG: DUF6498-containing protein [Pseudomonadota bacterium]|nr:DUF6498-containing protein [Pseudomonadota bacterium]